jgi:hypothetical protein
MLAALCLVNVRAQPVNISNNTRVLKVGEGVVDE